MKVLIVLATFFASFQAMAAVALRIPQGEFHFREAQALSVKHFEAVYATEKQRLAELKKLKYVCTPATVTIYQCSKFDKNRTLPKSVLERIFNDVGSEVVTFGKMTGTPVLVTAGEVFQDWIVTHDVTWNEQSFKKYSYMIAQDVHKIVPLVEDQKQELTWIVDSPTQLREPRIYNVQETPRTYTQYFVGVVLESKPANE